MKGRRKVGVFRGSSATKLKTGSRRTCVSSERIGHGRKKDVEDICRQKSKTQLRICRSDLNEHKSNFGICSVLYLVHDMHCEEETLVLFIVLPLRYATLLWDWNVEERILYLYQVMSRVLLSIDMYTIVYCQFSHGGFLDVIFRDQQRSSHFLFASSSSLSVWYRNQRYQQSSECRYEHLYKCLDDCLLYLLAIRLWCFLVIINCRKSRSSTSSQS